MWSKNRSTGTPKLRPSMSEHPQLELPPIPTKKTNLELWCHWKYSTRRRSFPINLTPVATRAARRMIPNMGPLIRPFAGSAAGSANSTPRIRGDVRMTAGDYRPPSVTSHASTDSASPPPSAAMSRSMPPPTTSSAERRDGGRYAWRLPVGRLEKIDVASANQLRKHSPSIVVQASTPTTVNTPPAGRMGPKRSSNLGGAGRSNGVASASSFDALAAMISAQKKTLNADNMMMMIRQSSDQTHNSRRQQLRRAKAVCGVGTSEMTVGNGVDDGASPPSKLSPNLRRPTRTVTRIDSVVHEDGYVQLNQYKLMEAIGEITDHRSMAHLQQAKEVAKLPLDSFYLTHNGRPVTDVPLYLRNVDPQSYLCVIPRVLGGKGGFSSLLRSFRIYRSTNQEMCRDLTGRRLKDVKEEERLRKWVAAAEKREQEKREKFEEKYARLKAGPGKHDFTDVEYEKAKQQMLEQNEEAFEQGIKEFFSGADVASSSSSSTAAGPSRKRSAAAKTSDGKAKRQKADNWLGIEGLSDTDSDGESEQVPVEIAVVDLDGSPDENTDEISVVDLEPRGEQTEKSAQPKQSTAEREVVKAATEAPTAAAEPPAIPPTSSNPEEIEGERHYEPIDVESATSLSVLLALDPEHLKLELQRRGLKCGGTREERARRLFSLKGLKPEEYPMDLKLKQKK